MAFAFNALSEVNIPKGLTTMGAGVFNSCGRYVVLTGENSIIKPDITEGKFGSVVNPVSIWVQGIDKESKKVILSTEELKFDPYVEVPLTEMLLKDNKIDVKAPKVKKYKAEDSIQQTLTAEFLDTNSSENPVVINYLPSADEPIFKGVDTLEIILGTPQDQIDLKKGITAEDVDGQDLTSRIKVKPSTVDATVEGRTFVTLTVSDDAGNTATTKREVIVTRDPWDTECGKGWIMRDFQFDGNEVLGLSTEGEEKLKTNKTIVLPNFNPNYTAEGKHETITKVADNAFKNLELSSISLPEKLEEIGDAAFSGNNLVACVLPETLTSIGSGAFQNNHLLKIDIPSKCLNLKVNAFKNNNLAKVTLPEGIKTIPTRCFENNNLILVTLPESVVEIGNAAFSNNHLGVLSLPENVEKVHDNAFASNEISSLILNEKLKSIGAAAFKDNKIESVKIPNAVESIGVSAFENNDIRSYSYPSDLTYIPNRCFANNKIVKPIFSDKLEVINESAFEHNLIQELDIPAHVKTIANKAFFKNFDLGRVSFTEGLETIGELAFASCGFKMDKLSFPSTLKTVGNGAFSGEESTMQIHEVEFADGTTSIGNSAFYKVYMNTLTLPSTVTSIGTSAFSDNNLKTLDIPDSVTCIRNSAFSKNALQQVKLPANLKTIKDNAFKDNPTLTTIDFPESLTTIGSSAFCNCGLTSVEIPSQVTSIGGSAFESNNIESLVLPDGLQYLNNHVFDKNKLTHVKLPSQLKEIYGHAFENNNLEEVEIPEGVTKIHNNAFANNRIVKTKLPSTLKYIGDRAFYWNVLTALDIPDGVSSIGEWAFANNSLNTLHLPKSITEIKNSAFKLNLLPEVVIPAGVESIANSAFGTNELTKVEFEEGSKLAKVGTAAFQGNKLSEVNMPSSIKTIEKSAFLNNDGWNPFPGEPIWADTATPSSNGVANMGNAVAKVKLNIKNGEELVFPKNLQSGKGVSYTVNSSILKVNRVLEGSSDAIASPEFIEVPLNETKTITPENNRYYSPVNTDPVSVVMDKDSKTLTLDYKTNPEFDPQAFHVHVHHYDPATHRSWDGLENRYPGNRVNLKIDVENSGDDHKIKKPWVVLDLNKPSGAGILEDVKFVDGDNIASEWKVENGKLMIHFKNDLEKDSVSLKVSLKFAKPYFIPNGSILDLTGAATLQEGNTVLATSKEKVGMRCSSSRSSFNKTGEQHLTAEVYKEVNGKKYASIDNPVSNVFDFSGQYYRITAEGKIVDKIPTYTGIDKDGNIKKMKAVFDAELSPGWKLSADGNHVEVTTIGLPNTSQEYDELKHAPVVFKFPGAEMGTWISNQMDIEFVGKNPGKTYQGTNEEAKKKFAEGAPYEPEVNPKRQSTRSMKIDPIETDAVEKHPDEKGADIKVYKRCTADFGATNYSIFLSEDHISDRHIIKFMNNGILRTLWNDEFSYNSHYIDGFYDTKEARSKEFVWGVNLEIERSSVTDNVVISDTHLDPRMKFVALALPEGIDSATLKIFDGDNLQGKTVFDKKIYPGRIDLPDVVSDKGKSFKIEIDATLEGNSQEIAAFNKMKVITKLRDPESSAYTFSTNGIRDERNQFANTITAEARLQNLKGDTFNKSSKSTEKICVLPVNEGRMSFSKQYTTKGNIFGNSRVTFDLNAKSFKTEESTARNFKVVDVLPTNVLPEELEFSEEFLNKAVNPQYEFVNNIDNKGHWGVVITADSYNAAKGVKHKKVIPYVDVTDKIASLTCITDKFIDDGKYSNKAFMAFESDKLDGTNKDQIVPVQEGKKQTFEKDGSRLASELASYPEKNILSDAAEFNVMVSSKFSSYQSIKAGDDPNTPWSTHGIPIEEDSPYNYRLNFKRSQSTIPDNFDVIQTLPYNDDSRLQVNNEGVQVARGTEMTGIQTTGEPYSAQVHMRGPLTCEDPALADKFIYRYAIADPSGYKKVKPETLRDNITWVEQDQLPTDESGNPDWSRVTAVRITAKDAKEALKQETPIHFDLPMQTPKNKNFALDGKVAVTSFVRWITNSPAEDAVEVNNVWVYMHSKRVDLKIQKDGEDATLPMGKQIYPMENVQFSLWPIYNKTVDGKASHHEVTLDNGTTVQVLDKAVDPNPSMGSENAEGTVVTTNENASNDVKTNAFGNILYNNVRTNRDYVLIEDVPDGYKKAETSQVVQGTWLIDNANESGVATKRILNQKKIKLVPIVPLKLALKFNKLDAAGLPLPYTKFELRATSSTGYKYSQSALSQSLTGLVEFNDIPAFGQLPDAEGHGSAMTLYETAPHGVLNPAHPIELHFAKHMVDGQWQPESEITRNEKGEVIRIDSFGYDDFAGGSFNIPAITNATAHLDVYKLGIFTKEGLNAKPVDLTKSSGKRLSGVKLNLSDESGQIVDSVSTNDNGSARFSSLKVGKKYYISEPGQVEGYKKFSDKIEVEVDRFGGIKVNGEASRNDYVVVPNEPIKLTNTLELHKSDQPDGQGNALAGAKFALYRIDPGILGVGETKTQIGDIKTTDDKGSIIFEDFGVDNPGEASVQLHKQVFQLEEISPAVGFANTFKPYRFETSDKDVTFVHVDAYNAPVKLSISKKQKGTDTPVSGAKFALYDSADASGSPIETQISNELGVVKFTYTHFDTSKIYSVKEIEVPVGYNQHDLNRVYPVVLSDYEAREGYTGNIVLDIENELTDASLLITKRDRFTNSPLAGAKFAIFDKDGNNQIGPEVISDEQGKVFFDHLEAGNTYTVKELEAPKGFNKADDVKIRIDQPKDYYLTISDSRKPIKIDLHKNAVVNNDSTTKHDIEGLSFNLKKMVGVLPLIDLGSVTTDAEGKASFEGLEVGSKYLLTEDDSTVSQQQLDNIGAWLGFGKGSWYIEVKDAGIGKSPVIEVQEKDVQEPKASFEVNKHEVTITNKRINPAQGTITLNKNFVGGEKLPNATYTFKLLRKADTNASPEEVDSKSLTTGDIKGSSAKLVFENLDVDYFDKDSGTCKKWIYSVEEEIQASDYRAHFNTEIATVGEHGEFTSAKNPKEEVTVKNTYVPATAKITLNKDWGKNGPDTKPNTWFKLSRSVGTKFETVEISKLAQGVNSLERNALPLTDASGLVYTYKVEECNEAGKIVSPENYTVNYVGDNTWVPNAASNNEEHSFKVVNTYKAEGSPVIEFTKNLNGEQRGTTFANKPFNFGLYDEAGALVAKARADKDGNIVFNKNKDIDALKFTQDHIGKTYTYTAKEVIEDLPGITYDDSDHKVEISVIDAKDGTLTFEYKYLDDSKVFNNQYAAGDVQATVNVAKQIEGRDWFDGDTYTFKISPSAHEGEATVELPANAQEVSITKASEGKASLPINFTYADMKGEKQQTFGFDVVEVKPENNAVAGVTYDTHTEHVSITVKDNYETGKLEIASITYSGGKDKAEFTNTVNPVESSPTGKSQLTGIKKLDGRPIADGEFTFNLYDAANKEKPLQTVTCDENGNFAFKAIKFDHADTYTYYVSEQEGSRAGVSYDYHAYEIQAQVSANSKDSSQLDVNWIISGYDDGDQVTKLEAKELKFENSYTSEQTTAAIAVAKQLKGRTWLDGESYEFKLVAAPAEQEVAYKLSEKQSLLVLNSVNTEGKFAQLAFTQDMLAGKEQQTFGFDVVEVKPENNAVAGVAYDTHTEHVSITVKDNYETGKLEIVSITYSDGKDKAEFTNTYKAEDISATINVAKQLKGRTWLDGESYEFKLVAAPAENEVAYKLSEKQSSLVLNSVHTEGKFAQLAFTQDMLAGKEQQTFGFDVVEVKPENNAVAGVTYDTHTEHVSITVKDNYETGKLEIVSITYSDGKDKAEFTNTYKAEDISATINVAKQLKGRDWFDGDNYTFKISPKADEGEATVELPANAQEVSITKASEGKASLPINFTFADMKGEKQQTFGFDVVEVKPENNAVAGVAYDTHTEHVSITVKDNYKTGKLEIVSITYSDGKDKAEFTNTYKAEGSPVIIMKKKLNGKFAGSDPEGKPFSFELSDKDKNVLARTNSDKNGNIIFNEKADIEELNFSQENIGEIHEYVVREIAGTNKNVTYDKKEVKLTVKIIDNFDGTLSFEISYSDNSRLISNLDGKKKSRSDELKALLKKEDKLPTFENMYTKPEAQAARSPKTGDGSHLPIVISTFISTVMLGLLTAMRRKQSK